MDKVPVRVIFIFFPLSAWFLLIQKLSVYIIVPFRHIPQTVFFIDPVLPLVVSVLNTGSVIKIAMGDQPIFVVTVPFRPVKCLNAYQALPFMRPVFHRAPASVRIALDCYPSLAVILIGDIGIALGVDNPGDVGIPVIGIGGDPLVHMADIRHAAFPVFVLDETTRLVPKLRHSAVFIGNPNFMPAECDDFFCQNSVVSNFHPVPNTVRDGEELAL